MAEAGNLEPIVGAGLSGKKREMCIRLTVFLLILAKTTRKDVSEYGCSIGAEMRARVGGGSSRNSERESMNSPGQQ